MNSGWQCDCGSTYCHINSSDITRSGRTEIYFNCAMCGRFISLEDLEEDEGWYY